MNRVFLGVDVGGTKIAAAQVGVGGALGAVHTSPTPGDAGREALLDAIADTALRAAAGQPIAGLGVGTAGAVDAAAGVVVSATETLREWKGTDVRAGLRSRLGLAEGVPLAVHNDVDAHALGEYWRGAGVGVDSFLMLAVGTGVGGAVVLGGRLLMGAHHVAGEVAHVPVPGAEGLPCPCGRDGHLEALAAGPGIWRRYLALGGDPTVTSGREVAERISSDPLALRAVQDGADALGRGIAGLVTLLDPERVVIGGGFADPSSPWWQRMEATLRAQVIDALADVELLPARLGAQAAILGAARAAMTMNHKSR
ncbi:glucokinase [Luteococcus japonicus]|uniref:Glucokinase n=1 Tax=Luteococcus japonicus TaxID=33984 RepID=A0A3N1ZV67_9ACTN|nr:ROK family protein [Luteococcus japonicus]ROR54740.1 glucokinase [Luteococcus japonicus]